MSDEAASSDTEAKPARKARKQADAPRADMSYDEAGDHICGQIIALSMDAGRDFFFAKVVLQQALRNLGRRWVEEQQQRLESQ